MCKYTYQRKTLKIHRFCVEYGLNLPTSLSHDPVAKISGCCKDEYETGRHLVLLTFWDTYLADSMKTDTAKVA